MRSLLLTLGLSIATFCAITFFPDHNLDFPDDVNLGQLDSMTGLALPLSASRIHAPGKVEGASDIVRVNAMLRERIVDVLVTEGQFVASGDTLIKLDSADLRAQRIIATANLDVARAQLDRLESGARASEVAVARNEYQSQLATLNNAKLAFKRNTKLFRAKAISQQELDDVTSRLEELQASSEAARSRLQALERPAHHDEIRMAKARIRVAEAELERIDILLERAIVKAPCDGQILRVHASAGEISVADTTPLIEMVPEGQRFVYASVDEFDALEVRPGQSCQIFANGRSQQLDSGIVKLVEPAMQPKRVFGQWAGERTDTFSRRVKIALESDQALPIGLPVDVVILSEAISNVSQPRFNR